MFGADLDRRRRDVFQVHRDQGGLELGQQAQVGHLGRADAGGHLDLGDLVVGRHAGRPLAQPQAEALDQAAHLGAQVAAAFGNSEDRRQMAAVVRVQMGQPGLPAEEVLRIGDRITHLDGIRLTSNEDLIRYVQYRQPGDEIQVTIRRPQLVNREIDDVAQQDTLEFTVMTVTLKLGSAELLSRTGVAGESPVLVERRMQAQSIKRMHAMKARTVSFDSPLAEEFVFEPQRALESAEIDRAPEVALLLRQLEMVNSGQMELTPVLQRTWIDNLNRLRQMSMDPSLSEFQQLYLERIVERYEELILP